MYIDGLWYADLDKTKWFLYHPLIPVPSQSRSQPSAYLAGVRDDEFDCPGDFCYDENRKEVQVTRPWPELQILRVCRQAYLEANPVLWGSNYFIFRNAPFFKAFIRDRNTSQKKLLKNLCLVVRDGIREGGRACGCGIIKGLTGLQNLHIYLSTEFFSVGAFSKVLNHHELVGYQAFRFDEEMCEYHEHEAFYSIGKFAVLRPEHVKVDFVHSTREKGLGPPTLAQDYAQEVYNIITGVAAAPLWEYRVVVPRY